MTGHNGSANGSLQDNLLTFLHSREWDSIEERDAAAAAFMNRHNQQRVDDFCGLSPDQMTAFLFQPFDSPDMVSFPERLDEEPPPDIPIVLLLETLIQQIGPEGIRLTGTGNFNLRLCNEALERYYAAYTSGGDIDIPWQRVRTEEDFGALNRLHLTLKLGGLLRKRHGKAYWTRKAQALIDSGTQALLPPVFTTYARRLNWGYSDGFEELPFIQHSFLFPLYLVQRFGDQWQSDDFFAGHYLRAFPRLANQVEATWRSPDKILASALRVRVFDRMAWLFGLVETRSVKSEDSLLDHSQYRKGPLLGKLVQFHV